ncbi:MAG: LysE family translocator [Flavobacteriaceae bacterium]|nr:LysE family translocator [Flavobacteriaceae bacterium]
MGILFSFLITSLLLSLSPGPDNVYVLSNTLSNGKKAGFFTVLGLVFGCLFHTILLTFGISELISQSNTALIIIKVFGVLYLFFLAFKEFNSTVNLNINTNNKNYKSNLNHFITGLLMNILNPKVYFFFLGLFPAFLFVNPEQNHLTFKSQFFILGFIFMTVTAIVFSLIVIFSSVTSKYLVGKKLFHLLMKWIQIIIFISIAMIILFSV